MKAKSLLHGVLSVFILLSCIIASAQVQTARYVSMHASTGGYYEYLPQGYNPNGTETYPLILFCHGLGEVGPGNTSTLPQVLRNGIPKVINNGQFPTSFTVNGVTSKFIVISPQWNRWPLITDIDAVLNYIEANYKINRNKVYMTGLSMGGGITWDYGGCSSNLAYVQRLAGIVPVCGASSPSIYRARTIATYNLPVWALHNRNDPTVGSAGTEQYISMINQAPAPNPLARKTIFEVSGHDAWTRSYDPNYREEGKNVYEWMLQYQRNITGPPANPAPIVNTGADKTITLPTNSVAITATATDNGSIASLAWTKTAGPTQFNFSSTTSLNPTISNLVAGVYTFRLTATDNQQVTGFDEVKVTVNGAANPAPTANAGPDQTIILPTSSVTLAGAGSDPGGSITGYAWTKVAGPASFTIANGTTVSPVVSGLTAGTYTFRLTVTDNGQATGYDDVNIVVQPQSAAYKPIPGRIEAESWNGMFGVRTENTADVGGGKNVGWIEPGDWMDYNVNVATTGTYTVDFRIATPLTGKQIQLRKADGTVLGTLTIPATGHYQTWKTASISVALTAGNQVLRLHAPTDGWNLNWFEFALSATNPDPPTPPTPPTPPNPPTPPTPPTTGDKTIQVKMYAGANPYNNAAWNNWSIANASGLLKFTDGTVSTISASMNIPGSVADNGVNYPGGMAPAEVLRHTSYSTVQRTLTISGLDATKVYDIELYAGRSSSPNNSTLFISGGVNQTVATYNNSTQEAIFTSRIPDATGKIIITVNRLNTYNYLNGFTLVQKTPSTTRIEMPTAPSAITNGGTPPTAKTIESPAAKSTDVLVGKEEFGVFPNPFRDQVTLRINNQFTGTMNVFVIDQLGRIFSQQQFNKPQQSFYSTVILTNLKPGSYIMKVQIGEWSSSQKLIKVE